MKLPYYPCRLCSHNTTVINMYIATDYFIYLLIQSPTLHTKHWNYMKSNKVQQQCHTTQAAGVADQSVPGIILGNYTITKLVTGKV